MATETSSPSGETEASASEASRPTGWLEVRERGSITAIKAVVFFTTFLGRPFGRLIARAVALYYVLVSKPARRAIDALSQHLRARPATFGEAYRHVLRFAQCTLDSLFFARGITKPFRVTRDGDHHLAKLRDENRGAILLGAHLGSFTAMRMQSEKEKLPLYAVVVFRNARKLNTVLEELDPGRHATFLEMDPEGGMDFMLRIQEIVDRGGIVAMLADRVTGNARSVEAPFLGAPARFAAGPFLVAAMLKCPVYFTCGIYRDPNLYELHCEPFAERIELPRKEREAALARYVAQYAERLEHYVRAAPDNWFNFFDFWAPAAPPMTPPAQREPAR